MRLGVSSWAYPWAVGVPNHPVARPLSAVDLVHRAVSLDVPVLQVADNLPLHRMGQEEVSKLRTEADHHGVALELGTCGFTTDHLLTYLELASAIGSPILRVVIDTPDLQPDPTEIQQTLRTVLPEFERVGVSLLIENHDRFTAEELKQILLSAGNERLGVVLDTANSLGCLEDAERVLSTLGPWVRNVHIKDVAVARVPHRMGFAITGAPAGRGNLRLPELIAQISSFTTESNLILEQWPTFTGDVEETVAMEDIWARESVTYLRRLLR